MSLYKGTVKHVASTAAIFVAHWKQVNAELPQPLVLVGPVSQADLLALQQKLLAAEQNVSALQIDVSLARQAIRLLAKDLAVRVKQFNIMIRLSLVPEAFALLLKPAGKPGASEQQTLVPLREMGQTWAKNEALGDILVLAGSYTRTQFVADVVALQQAYVAHQNAKQNATLARADRDAVIRQIRAVLLKYRPTVFANFAGESAIVKALPRYSPARRKQEM